MIRYIIRNLKFSLKDITKNIFKALISSFGILFLISFMVLYLSLRESVKNYIGKKLFGTMAINEIVIYPKARRGSDVFSSLAGRKNTISPSKVVKIRRMKEFKKVFSLIRLNYQSKVKVELMGRSKKPHAPLYGIEASYFKGKHRRWYQFRNRDILPVIVPKLALKLLNSYTAVKGMPQFTANMLVGFSGDIFIRTTDYGDPDEKQFVIPASVHSFSDEIDFTGILVPSSFITKFAKKHRRDSGRYKKGYSFVRMYAYIKDVKKLPAVTKKLKKMNLTVKSQSDISKKTNRALQIIDGISILIGSVILILTILAIFNSYLIIVHNRSYGFSLKRVIGVSKVRIVINFLIEAALIGIIYGTIGFYAGKFLTIYTSLHIAEWVPALEGLKLVPAGNELLITAITLSVIVSCISALVPALFASNMNLFKAVRKVG